MRYDLQKKVSYICDHKDSVWFMAYVRYNKIYSISNLYVFHFSFHDHDDLFYRKI